MTRHVTVTFEFDVDDNTTDDTVESVVNDAWVQLDEAVDWSSVPADEPALDAPQVPTYNLTSDLNIEERKS